MFFVLLAGCFSSNSRDYTEYLIDLERQAAPVPTADTATPAVSTPPVTPPPDPTPEACSTVDGEPIDVVFTNQLGFHVDLYFVNPDCSTQNITLVQSGDTHARTTHVGAVWRARDAFGGRGFVHEVRVEAGQTDLVMP